MAEGIKRRGMPELDRAGDSKYDLLVKVHKQTNKTREKKKKTQLAYLAKFLRGSRSCVCP